MARRGISGISLLKTSSGGKFNESPERTQRFLDAIENENLEGKIPPEGDFTFSTYNGYSYTINRNGVIKTRNGQIMTPFFSVGKRGLKTRIKIKIMTKDGLKAKEKEISILKLMDQFFGKYIHGYSKKKLSPKNYILIPKDGNYNNVSWENLEYVHRGIFREKGTQRAKLRTLLSLNTISDKQILSATGAAHSELGKMKKKMAEEGHLPYYQRLLKLRKELGFEITEDMVPVYEALLQSGGKLSNSEIAFVLWRENYRSSNPREKKNLTTKISRARKKLTDREIIPRYNGDFERKREAAIKMLSEVNTTRHTHQEIADILGLNKGQIDNLARQIKDTVKN